jgi:hypothetical protein
MISDVQICNSFKCCLFESQEQKENIFYLLKIETNFYKMYLLFQFLIGATIYTTFLRDQAL